MSNEPAASPLADSTEVAASQFVEASYAPTLPTTSMLDGGGSSILGKSFNEYQPPNLIVNAFDDEDDEDEDEDVDGDRGRQSPSVVQAVPMRRSSSPAPTSESSPSSMYETVGTTLDGSTDESEPLFALEQSE
jgi:hypothetical protein